MAEPSERTAAPTHPKDAATVSKSGPSGGLASRVGKDLGQRVVSGLAMAIVALAALWTSPLSFGILVTVVVAVLAWEWGHVVRGGNGDIATAAHIGAVVAALVLTVMGQEVLALLALAIGLILVGLLTVGQNAGLSAAGVAYAGLPGVALTWLRADPSYGFAAVLFIILCVAATDIAAYFSGRLIGGPKIWPSVSPNKTWAGLIGAIVAAAVVGTVYAMWIPGANSQRLALLGALFAVIAQAGDFAESALKRRFGAKDASALIPGHGGFMDRVDGLVTAAVAAAILAALSNLHAPARALLQW